MKIRKANKKGFTLIELLGTIAIVAILVAVVVPAIADYTGIAEDTAKKRNAQVVQEAVNRFYGLDAATLQSIADDTTTYPDQESFDVAVLDALKDPTHTNPSSIPTQSLPANADTSEIAGTINIDRTNFAVSVQ